MMIMAAIIRTRLAPSCGRLLLESMEDGESILKYRQEHGNFQSIEDLKKIEGIKDGVFNKIKDDITV